MSWSCGWYLVDCYKLKLKFAVSGVQQQQQNYQKTGGITWNTTHLEQKICWLKKWFIVIRLPIIWYFFSICMFCLKAPISFMCLFECFINNLPLFFTTEQLFKAISSATLPSEHFLSSCPAQPITLILWLLPSRYKLEPRSKVRERRMFHLEYCNLALRYARGQLKHGWLTFRLKADDGKAWKQPRTTKVVTDQKRRWPRWCLKKHSHHSQTVYFLSGSLKFVRRQR